MNVRHLEHLLAVADTGSFSRAAERQHITQSALSRSIAALEDEVGGLLLDRVGKRNELNPLGRQVVSRARRIVLEASEIRRGAELMRQADLGSLRVGLGSGPGAILMTPLMCHMATHHPRVKVVISRGPTELQLVQLRARQLDALVVDMRRVSPSADLSVVPIAEMSGGWVVRRGHPLLAKRQVSFEHALAFPIASTPLSDEVARVLVRHYGPRADPAQMITLQGEDVASLLDVVVQTDTIFMGVLAAARAGIESGALRILPLRPVLKASAQFGYITLSGRTEAPVMAILRDFIAERMVD